MGVKVKTVLRKKPLPLTVTGSPHCGHPADACGWPVPHHEHVTVVVELLDRPLYGVGQAAALLGVRSPATLRRWLDGYTRDGRLYRPVIRAEPTGDDVLTWGEFVEARYLAGLRADGASLQLLRQVVDALRAEYGQYPLANARPFMDGRDVVRRVQERLGVPRRLQLVVVRNGQTKLSPVAQDFVDHVEYAQDDLAAALRPAGPRSPVVIDPTRGFGMPSIEGRNIRTEILAELSVAGESNEAIADAYDLTTDQVEAALRFELQVARTAVA
jgi:uncharacterized protein (DUF433 family)